MFEDFAQYAAHYHDTLGVIRRARFLNVIVDITNACNIRCVMCSLTAEDPDKRQRAVFLSRPEFDRMMGDLLPLTALLRLSCGYEPLASPHFVDILESVRQFRVPYVDLVTNGTLLRGKKLDAIIRCGVDMVVVSMDSSRKETFEGIRVGAKFDTVVENVTRLSQRKRELRSRTPALALGVMLMRRNVDHLDELFHLAADLGVAEIHLQQLFAIDGLGLETETLADEPERVDATLNRARDLAAQLGIRLVSPRNPGAAYRPSRATIVRNRWIALRAKADRVLSHPGDSVRSMASRAFDALQARRRERAARPYCIMPFNHVVVSPGARVKPCAFASDEFIEVCDPGGSVGAIVRGERFDTLRRRILAGDAPEMCRRCPEMGMYNTLRTGE